MNATTNKNEVLQPYLFFDGRCEEAIEFYRKALLAKIALESAQAAAKKKNGEYRNVLKDAKKAGVNSESLAFTNRRCDL